MPKLIRPNLIIQVRGTSGSGKTTVMRKVMDMMGDWNSGFMDGRRNPLFYTSASEWPTTSVVGSYASNCGGVDTISGYGLLLKTVEELHKKGHVLMEGLLLSEDVKQTLTLLPKKLKIIFLDTQVDECINRVKKRRVTAGNEKPLKEDNTRRRVDVIQRARERLVGAGVFCTSAKTEEAADLILSWIREGK